MRGDDTKHCGGVRVRRKLQGKEGTKEVITEHIRRVNDTVQSTGNALLTMLMASTALQDFNQNTDMRKISSWVAIAAVPTLTAGIYGMNFKDMPELNLSFGYPIVLAFMATTCGLLYRGFKNSGWL